MQRNAAVQTLLEDVQLGGLPVVSVQDTGAAFERTMKRKAGATGSRRANTAMQEKLALQSRYETSFRLHLKSASFRTTHRNGMVQKLLVVQARHCNSPLHISALKD